MFLRILRRLVEQLQTMKCDDCGLGLLIKMARLRVSSASLRTNERSKALGLMGKHLDHYMERF
jgi:hypothetical protein